MKDKSARALAIVALVFMAIFLGSFTATLVSPALLGGFIAVVALCSGLVVLVIFVVLKADKRGYSLTEMKNESELQKIEQALKDQEEQEQKSAEENPDAVEEAEEPAASDGSEANDEKPSSD